MTRKHRRASLSRASSLSASAVDWRRLDRPVLRSWKDGDTSVNTSTGNFNGPQLVEYALTRFRALKLEQRQLIGASADLTRLADKRPINTGTASESVVVAVNYRDAS